jgi:hypothetical protein
VLDRGEDRGPDAMIATLLVGEYLAGLIIVLMLTGGDALEKMAQARAGRIRDQIIV